MYRAPRGVIRRTDEVARIQTLRVAYPRPAHLPVDGRLRDPVYCRQGGLQPLPAVRSCHIPDQQLGYFQGLSSIHSAQQESFAGSL